MKKWIGEGINSDLKSSVSNNVLNVVRALVEDEKSIVYIPNTYANGSTYRTTPDPAVHFLPSECGKSIKVTGIQSNQERYNFSMIGLVDVIVEFPQDDGSVEVRNMKIFRQYNIVRDGKLVVDYVSAKLSPESFDDLKKIGILYYNGVIVPENHKHNPDYVYKIVLKDLPIVSSSWAQPVRIGLIKNMEREEEISSKLKVLRILKKEYESLGMFVPTSSDESDIYTEKYGKSSKVEDKETEEVECIVYEIKVPSSSYTIEDARKEYEDMKSLNDAIRNLNKELRYVRFIIRCIVYSVEESRKKGSYDWSELEDVPRSKNKKRQTTNVNVDGKDYILTRTVYTKTV